MPRLRINSCPAEVLDALPYIGPKRAEAIVRHRERHGPFRSAADLRRVLPPAIVPKVVPYISFAVAPFVESVARHSVRWRIGKWLARLLLVLVSVLLLLYWLGLLNYLVNEKDKDDPVPGWWMVLTALNFTTIALSFFLALATLCRLALARSVTESDGECRRLSWLIGVWSVSIILDYAVFLTGAAWANSRATAESTLNLLWTWTTHKPMGAVGPVAVLAVAGFFMVGTLAPRLCYRTWFRVAMETTAIVSAATWAYVFSRMAAVDAMSLDTDNMLVLSIVTALLASFCIIAVLPLAVFAIASSIRLYRGRFTLAATMMEVFGLLAEQRRDKPAVDAEEFTMELLDGHPVQISPEEVRSAVHSNMGPVQESAVRAIVIGTVAGWLSMNLWWCQERMTSPPPTPAQNGPAQDAPTQAEPASPSASPEAAPAPTQEADPDASNAQTETTNE